MIYNFGAKNMDWHNITLIDVLAAVSIILIYPIYWVLVHKLMDSIFKR